MGLYLLLLAGLLINVPPRGRVDADLADGNRVHSDGHHVTIANRRFVKKKMPKVHKTNF